MTFRLALPAGARLALLTVTGSLMAALAVQVSWYELVFPTREADWKSIALVVATVFFLATLLSLVSRRLIAPVAVACGLMVLLATISVAKFQHLRASLHALDFYYYGRPTEVVFLAQHFPKIFYPALAITLAFIAMVWLLFVVDDTRIPRKLSVGVCLVATLLLGGAFHWRGQRSKVYHFNGLHHVSSVIASAPETLGVFSRGGLLRGADLGGTIDSTPDPSLQNAIPDVRPPTIIAILHESSFPVSIYPIQCGGPTPGPLYTSSNNEKYDLRVETFGGATWITEYGLMLGLSTYYFGEARSFIGYTMENRVRDSLPLQLKRDGYLSVALYPSPRSFVNTGRFYASIGFDKVLDYYDIHAQSERERDRFYYERALEQIRAQKASGSKAPLFVFVWTMATHAPYDYTLFPGMKPDSASICSKGDDDWSEYIRRLLISEVDLKWFTDTLKSEFPDEPFMLLGFGDHQPFIAGEFLEPNPDNPVVPKLNTIGYKTFYRILGVNYEPDFSHLPKSVDTPFLGNVMMLAARLPRHGFYNDRDKLMLLCDGRYNDCPHQNEILSFHERLIRSSTILNR